MSRLNYTFFCHHYKKNDKFFIYIATKVVKYGLSRTGYEPKGMKTQDKPIVIPLDKPNSLHLQHHNELTNHETESDQKMQNPFEIV
jgi:hypothetical protein